MRLKSSGFTLIEAMVASAAAVVILLGIASSIASMVTNQAKSDAANEAAMASQQIIENLKSGPVCTTALAGQKLGGGSSSEVSISLPMDGSTGLTKIQKDSVIRPGVSVASLQLLKNPAVPPVDVFLPSGAVNKQYLGDLRLIMSRTVNGTISNAPAVDIPLKLVVDSSQTVQLCNTDTSTSRVCIESGGSWDASQPAGQQCIPKSTCQFAGGFSEALTSNGGYVNELTGAQNCPSGFTAVRSGTTATANKCGKYCIGNTYSADFTCVKCGTDLPIVGTAGAIGQTSPSPSFDYSSDVTSVTSTTSEVNSQVVNAQTSPTPSP